MHSRQIHTPLTIGSFFIASVTGILMFFELASGGIRATHEWMSLLFVLAAGLHIYANKRPFIRYFADKPLFITAATVIGGLALYALSYNDIYLAEASFQLLTHIEVSKLLMTLEISHAELLIRLKPLDITIVNPEQSLDDIANLYERDVHDLLELVIKP